MVPGLHAGTPHDVSLRGSYVSVRFKSPPPRHIVGIPIAHCERS